MMPRIRLFVSNPDAKSCFSRGKSKLESGNHKGAIAEFTKSIELDQKFAAAYFQSWSRKTADRRQTWQSG